MKHSMLVANERYAYHLPTTEVHDIRDDVPRIERSRSLEKMKIERFGLLANTLKLNRAASAIGHDGIDRPSWAA